MPDLPPLPQSEYQAHRLKQQQDHFRRQAKALELRVIDEELRTQAARNAHDRDLVMFAEILGMPANARTDAIAEEMQRLVAEVVASRKAGVE